MINDYIIVGIGVCIFLVCMQAYWKKYTHDRFIAKLKHGDGWHKELDVEEHSFYGAKIWLKKHA